MAVKRIVADLHADAPGEVAAFYEAVFGLRRVMDMGWIATLAADQTPVSPQLSLAREGGAGTPVPAISIEVDDFDETLARARSAGAPIEYGPTTEVWGVRRFFLRDPAGHLVNVLTHDVSEDKEA